DKTDDETDDKTDDEDDEDDSDKQDKTDGKAEKGESKRADSTNGSGSSGTSQSSTTSKSAEAPTGPRRSTSGESGPILASPLVRRLLREAGIDASSVAATGPGGRITRQDADGAIARGATRDASDGSAGSDRARRERPNASPVEIDFDGDREITQDLSRIRKAIARSMMDSLHNTAQLTAAVEADLTAIMQLRNAIKDDFKEREGASLTPLAIIARAVCMTLPRHPALNASIDQEAGTATYHSFINLGIAVDTERGLLVPNLKDAQDLDAAGVARAIGDIAKRTRDRKLGPDDIAGGTFTITNTGSMGTLFDTPILNPPEAAILATPAIEKRPVVISDGLSDAIAIRWMTYLCLTYDHRIVDGADAARFLQDLKWVLEEHDFGPELGA
ncbi:MAG: dihydrolipoamide acetyltransferase family protein, partial [Nitriliruptoraceae bacterium]